MLSVDKLPIYLTGFFKYLPNNKALLSKTCGEKKMVNPFPAILRGKKNFFCGFPKGRTCLGYRDLII